MNETALAHISGQVQAMHVCINAILTSMPEKQRASVAAVLAELSEHHHAQLLAVPVPDRTIQAYQEVMHAMRKLVALR